MVQIAFVLESGFMSKDIVYHCCLCESAIVILRLQTIRAQNLDDTVASDTVESRCRELLGCLLRQWIFGQSP